MDEINRRLQTIERLVWMGLGGSAIVMMLAVTGITLVLKQSDRIDAVALRQAAAIAERSAHIEALKADIHRLQEARR